MRACDSVALQVAAGEIHALLGENGAGKTTLMRIVAGEVRADDGAIELDGRRVILPSPRAARALGIAMVHQHFALFDSLTVAENIALGLESPPPPDAVSCQISVLAERYGLVMDPAARIDDLSMGERQRVEILRALLARPRLLILDEPTSVLTSSAVQRLFDALRQLAAEGVSIVFVSHKLDEIRALAQRCTVMRAGRVVACVDPRAESDASLARLMIGAEPPRIPSATATRGAARLVARGLKAGAGGEPLHFVVHAGEIVGIAGISGNGQGELMRTLAGEILVPDAQLELDRQPIGSLDPRARRRRGLRYVPEERLRHATVPELTLAANMLLTVDRLFRGGIVDRAGAREAARRVIAQFDVRCSGPDAIAASLSGGNLQKFIVGREVLAEPAVLLVHQPTWGVDVGAASTIRSALVQLKNRGCAVLVVSEEIDELFEICDRLMVIASGRLSPAVNPDALPIEELGRWMAGRWPAAVGSAAAS